MLIKQMENYILQHKDPSPKTVADTCHIILGWPSIYGNSNTRLTEPNDGVAFTTIGTEDIKGNKRKQITC